MDVKTVVAKVLALEMSCYPEKNFLNLCNFFKTYITFFKVT